MQQEKHNLEERTAQLANHTEVMETKLMQKTQHCNELKQRETHWREESQRWQKQAETDGKNRELLQTELAIVTEKLSRAESDITALTEQTTHLFREKWALGQVLP